MDAEDSPKPRRPARRVRPGESRRPDPVEPPVAETEAPPSKVPTPVAPPSTSETPGSKLDLDDLEMLASMSPEDLAALMEGNTQGRTLEPGAKVEGQITRVGPRHPFRGPRGKVRRPTRSRRTS